MEDDSLSYKASICRKRPNKQYKSPIMRYLPICSKYGQLPYYAIWVALPYVAMAFGYLYFAISYLICYLLLGPCLEHEVAVILKRKRIGLTRGSRILQRAQVGGILVALLLGIVVEKITEQYINPDFRPIARSSQPVSAPVPE